MNKIMVTIVCLALVFNVNIAIAEPNENPCKGMTGAVWATLSDYNRDTEYFGIGTDVYVTGANFANQNVPLGGIVYWTVTDQSADGPVKPTIVSGTANLLQLESQNPYALYPNAKPSYINPVFMLTITPGLVGKDLRLNVWHQSWPELQCSDDFKIVKDTFYAIPEFPTIALPVAGAIALMFFFHIRRKKEEKEE